ncbi:MAG: FAD-dependent oxidoreductase [Clostridiales bacterium]|nr:FAD-dependent oxidoreductase [Clostridiales bacterium]
MKLEKALTPLQIASCTIPNRLAITAMVTNYCTVDGMATERYIRYHEERAKGGWGLIITEDYTISRHAGAFTNVAAMWRDEHVESHRELTDRIHKYGTKIFCQLYHAGRQTFSLVNGGVQPVAPSPIACPINREMPRELTVPEIREIAEDFGKAAGRAKRAGFDGVELPGGNGYLISGFMSHYENRRTDEYGGCFLNRMRFVKEIYGSVRAAVGDDFPVTIRFSAEEYEPDGRTLAEARMTAQYFEELGFDAINCSNGVYGSYNPSQISTHHMPHAWTTGNAAELKKVVKIPVLGVNRITDPLMAEQLLQMGICDMVGMSRASLADPELPNKAKAGEFEGIRTCLACLQGCIGSLIVGGACRCLVNPRTGYEHEYTFESAVPKKNVLVIGGGVAGLEAAIAAARRGHSVTLWERRGRLGGQFVAASYPPGKGEYTTYITSLAFEAKKYGVKVELETEATVEAIKAHNADKVILATGAVPKLPDIPGVDRPNVVVAEDVLLGKTPVEGRIVIAGGGETGLETALYLACSERGHISIVTSYGDVGGGGNISKLIQERRLARERGVQTVAHAKLTEICESGVLLEKNGVAVLMPCDWVVIAKGYCSNGALAGELGFLGEKLTVVGDAKKAADALAASSSGFRAGYYA